MLLLLDSGSLISILNDLIACREGFRVLKAAPEPVNAFVNMMQQMGMDIPSTNTPKPTILDPSTPGTIKD